MNWYIKAILIGVCIMVYGFAILFESGWTENWKVVIGISVFYIGGGIAAVGAAVALIKGGDDGSI